MIRLGFVIPGSLDSPTGGTRYDRDVLARLSKFEIVANPLLVAACYPFPSDTDRLATKQSFLSASVDLFLIDGLVFGALSDQELAALQKPVLVLLHHPLADETGLAPDTANQLYLREKHNLQHAQAVIVTSQKTKDRLIAHYDVKADDITVAEPGVTKPDRITIRSPLSPDKPAKLLSVGGISPRKNYGLVLDALALLPNQHKWIWTIAGRLDDTNETQRLQKKTQDLGLIEQVQWLGSLSEERLAALYHDSDILLYPSHYEGYGMALDEALAYGLPVLASDHIPSAHAHASPAIRCLDPLTPRAWCEALSDLLNDADSFHKACFSASELAKRLPDWDHPTDRIVSLITRIHQKGKSSP